MGKVIMSGGGGFVDLDGITTIASDILFGLVSVDKEGEPLIGTMPNNGAVNISLNAGGSYTIPRGYHDGNGRIVVNTLASHTPATATAGTILSGYTAWINGLKITGNMSISSIIPY